VPVLVPVGVEADVVRRRHDLPQRVRVLAQVGLAPGYEREWSADVPQAVAPAG
jgi:hypothetical protein